MKRISAIVMEVAVKHVVVVMKNAVVVVNKAVNIVKAPNYLGAFLIPAFFL